MVIYVHTDCPHSAKLTDWLMQNVSDDDKPKIQLQYPEPDIEHVPCVKNKDAVGFKQCVSLIIKTFGVKETQKPKSQSLEDTLQQMISQRKGNGPGVSVSAVVQPRALPAC